MVPGGGVEPPRGCPRRILSPLRLPVPPSRLIDPGLIRNPGSVLQSPATEVSNKQLSCQLCASPVSHRHYAASNCLSPAKISERETLTRARAMLLHERRSNHHTSPAKPVYLLRRQRRTRPAVQERSDRDVASWTIPLPAPTHRDQGC